MSDSVPQFLTLRNGALALGALSIVSVLVLSSTSALCRHTQKDGTATSYDTSLVAPGYVLIPISRVSENNTAKGEVRLVDASGVIVHTWTTPYQPLVAYLEDTGDLYVSMIAPLKLSEHPGGTTGIIERLNWNGETLFHYEDPLMNHDFEVLPDTTIAYTRWDGVPDSFASRIPGGLPTTEGNVWGNEIVVINQDKEVTWSWRTHEHLSPYDFPINDLVPDTDWTHINSIRYVEDNPFTHTSAYLLSIRNSSTVIFIDAINGTVLWHSPEGAYSLQHDATYLENGNVLVFDNGLSTKEHGYVPASRAIEINPLTDEIAWKYEGGESLFEKYLFASSIAGGTERLSNGNTLITLTTQNRIYEVTSDGKVVWEYASDYRDADGLLRAVFKARKYDGVGTEWSKRLPFTTDAISSLCTF